MYRSKYTMTAEPPRGFGLPGLEMPDYFRRGMGLMSQAGQTFGQMDKSRSETRTTTYEPGPMGPLDFLDAGVGYGLAGMKAYDIYRGWQGDDADPLGNVLKAFGRQAGGNNAGSGSGMFGNMGNPFTSPSGGTPISTASRALTSTQWGPGSVSTAGISGSSATAMGGRGAHEMLRGGVDTATGLSTAGNAAATAGKIMPVVGTGLSVFNAYNQGQSDRRGGGKNVGNAAMSAGNAAMAGFMMGGPVGAVIGGIAGGLGYMLG